MDFMQCTYSGCNQWDFVCEYLYSSKLYRHFLYGFVDCLYSTDQHFLWIHQGKKKYEVVFNSSIETLEKNKVRNDYFIDMLIKVSKKQQNKFLKAEEDYKKRY